MARGRTSLPLTHPSRHVRGGFYQISNVEARELARAAGRALPVSGYELSVRIPHETSHGQHPADAWMTKLDGKWVIYYQLRHR